MTDSIRMRAVDAVVSTLAAINGSSPYAVNLSGDGQVTKFQVAAEFRRSKSYTRSIVVVDGGETIERDFINSQSATARLEVLLDLLATDVGDDTMVDQLNDMLHDVSLALGSNRNLGAVVSDAFLFRIEPPFYDSANRSAECVVRIQVVYSFIAGQSI